MKLGLSTKKLGDTNERVSCFRTPGTGRADTDRRIVVENRSCPNQSGNGGVERRLALGIPGLFRTLAAPGGMHEPCDSDARQVEHDHGRGKNAHGREKNCPLRRTFLHI